MQQRHVDKATKYILTFLLCVYKGLPDKNLTDLSRVCRTFSLATLKNIFPSQSHWSKSSSSSTPIAPSPYVAEYIGKYRFVIVIVLISLKLLRNVPDRVLAPVVDALIPMRAETQQNVARITLKTFCEAWLEHIRGRRIKFRQVGTTHHAEGLVDPKGLVKN
jgi:hypothetical protein